MKAIVNSHYAPRDLWRVEELPEDIQTYPIMANTENTSICRSESTGKYYVIVNRTPAEYEPFPDVYACCVASGNWLDIVPFFSDGNYFGYAPFKWGVPVSSAYSDRVKYLPIWESVPTGKYDEEGFEQYHDIFKIVQMILDPFPDQSENYVQSNMRTAFEVFAYGENMVKLVEDFQMFTGKEY